MLYLIALILPPLAVLACGKPFQAATNLTILVVTFIFAFFGLMVAIPICLVHALFVVHNFYADERNARLMRAMNPGQVAPVEPADERSVSERASTLWNDLTH